MVYADPIDIIFSNQWVACSVSFSFISFTCSASGWPVCSQWVVYEVSFVFFRSRPLGLGSAWLEASRTQGLCVFLLGQTEI